MLLLLLSCYLMMSIYLIALQLAMRNICVKNLITT
jgi:hypothetical protein